MSPRTVAAKLRISPNSALSVTPPDRVTLLGPLPEGIRRTETLDDADVAVLFADDAQSLGALLAAAGPALHTPAVVWIAYPKGGKADLKRDTMPPYLTEVGMRPISQVAIDDVWSALRFRPLAEGETPFTGGA
jgi:hypothetical protein